MLPQYTKYWQSLTIFLSFTLLERNSLCYLFQGLVLSWSQIFCLNSQQWYHLQAASAGLQACDREFAVLNCSDFQDQNNIGFCFWGFRKPCNFINFRGFFWQFAACGIFRCSSTESVSLSNSMYHGARTKTDNVSGGKIAQFLQFKSNNVWGDLLINNIILTNIHQCTCCWAIIPEV